MRRLILLAALLSLALTSPGAAAEPCRIVHGRMSLANGAPTVRIWIIGTRRILGVAQPTQSLADLPDNIRRLWAANGDEAMWSTDLYGDFTVCPLAHDRPGRMQPVTLTTAKNLQLRPRR